jgi:hypothetical protein
MTASLTSYLGAARVVRHDDGGLVVALEEQPAAPETLVRATAALTFPYRPVVGDQLLVLGDERAFYAIGVLRGRGRTSLVGQRGVSLRAESGNLHVAGERGVRVKGPRVSIQAAHLRRLAVRAVETFEEQTRAVRERLSVEAADVDEQARGRWLLQARRVVLKALGNARIKSTTVRMG